MNLDEAVELLRAVSAIPIKDSQKQPEIHIIHSIGEGYTLHLKENLLKAEYRNHLNEIIRACKLEIRESNNYIVIYSNP